MAKNRVLFNSGRPLLRAENIKAVYRAYTGPKAFRKGSEVSDALLQKADVVVTDEFPTYLAQNIVMITHGIPLTKKYGLDQKSPWFTPKCVDYVIAPSKQVIPIMAKQAGISEEQVLPLGMPRTDTYIGKGKGDGDTLLATKKSYLYAPTFRNVTYGEGRLPSVDWDYIDSHLNDDEILAVKVHMRTGVSGLKKHYKHIVELDNMTPSAPYLIDCDVLITDYSSILFDGHILRKPIVLFEKDSERYYF